MPIVTSEKTTMVIIAMTTVDRTAARAGNLTGRTGMITAVISLAIATTTWEKRSPSR
jgi:hypothetical protein